MLAQQSLRRPANWQDFENLCKKLWGEIWKCPEIQKNGRLGQEQSGVDIFGIPFNENGYFGIQCKGKSEYNDDQYRHPQFTEKEIDDEIEKAKKFTPLLKKLYFATTALNDSKIQSYIRLKNQTHIQSGLFEVHLYCWETIVDLIDENRATHDWYLNNQKYRVERSAMVSFRDGSTEMEATPRFKKTITRYLQKIMPAANSAYENPLNFFLSQKSVLNRQLGSPSIFELSLRSSTNLSYFPIRLQIKNTGQTSIEEYKLIFEIRGEIQDVRKTNVTYPATSPESYRTQSPTIRLSPQKTEGEIIPNNSTLVGDDVFISDPFYIKPVLHPTDLIMHWKLLAKDFKQDGELLIKVKPKIETIQEEEITEDYLKVKKGPVEGVVEDVVEYEKN